MTKQITRRSVLTAGLTSAIVAIPAVQAPVGAATRSTLFVNDDDAGHALSPLIYGCNETGALFGEPLSAGLDRAAGVTARRLGGNWMSGYNWTNNATHAGKDYHHSNGASLVYTMRIPKERWKQPAIVIETMHEASLAMGAQSVVTVPLGRHAASGYGGPVEDTESAPSKRFVPVVWKSAAQAKDAINTDIADIPHLLRRLIAKYGPAGSARGISGYMLDNEPGLWRETHPRLFSQKPDIAGLIKRSIEVARIIKSIDPKALVYGPGSWGPTGMVSLQGAPDWKSYARYGSFLAAYLDAFAKASRGDGKRLLDVLDVHWYPYSAKGELYRTVDSKLDKDRLDAPRSLLEPGFRENSWVPRALSGHGADGLSLPILPSLQRTIAQWFPGTKLSVSEFNYGGPQSLVTGLALADALGAFGAGNVYLATHWGSLPGWLGQAYRLFRTADVQGNSFGGFSIPVDLSGQSDVAAYAAKRKSSCQLIVINKSIHPKVFNIQLASDRWKRSGAITGFDANHPKVQKLPETIRPIDGGWRILVPPRSARRYLFT